MTEPAIPAPAPRRVPFFFLGVLLFILGPVIYIVRFTMHRLEAPWYAPALATLGLVLFLISVWRRPGFFRIVGVVFFAILCAAEWYMLLVATLTPAYAGPAKVGAPVPAFATTLADGSALSDKSLADGGQSIVLFFRGRW